jgi:CheY-like chemotaxis protein
MMDAHKPLLLLVEDSPGDRLLIQYAIEGAGLDIRVESATNGQEAIKYLEGNGNYANRERYPLPTLIVTDIQMPVLSGLELLIWIKGQTELTGIPVVVMSTSGDREQALRRGASEYLDKTPKFKSLIGILEALCF